MAFSNPMIAMQLLSSLLGGKQVGAPAPAFNPGQSGGVAGTEMPQMPPVGGLLGGGATDAVNALAPQKSNPLIGPPKLTVDPQINSDSLKDESLADIDSLNPFQNFLGGLDRGLQSPAQMMGLGLLGQAGGNNNALPLAGLLGMGVMNRKGGIFNR